MEFNELLVALAISMLFNFFFIALNSYLLYGILLQRIKKNG